MEFPIRAHFYKLEKETYQIPVEKWENNKISKYIVHVQLLQDNKKLIKVR